MNRSIAERAVPPLQTPLPLLNLQVRTFSRTMVSTEQTLSASRASFCAVCCVKQLQNAAHRVNGSQADKRRAVMLYRVCFHTRSQTAGWIDCSCLTAQQTDRLPAAAELMGRACTGRQGLSPLLPDQLSCQSDVSFLLAYRAVSLGSQWERFIRWYCKVS